MIPFTGPASAWNELIASLPLAHLLQTWEWSQVKARYGWEAVPFVWNNAAGTPAAAAMVLKRRFPIGGFAKKMCVLYIPKGPLLDWADASTRLRVLGDLQSLAKQHGAIYIKLDPDVTLGTGMPGTEGALENISGQIILSELKQCGWKFSPDQIQFRNTVLIDLTPSEDEMLGRMKQKTRYNLHLAQKKGVTVRTGMESDLPLLYRMYAETSVRDGFLIREQGYYQNLWKSFMAVAGSASSSQPFTEALIAEVNGEPVGAVSVFYFARQAIYLLGMSREVHREKMPNYLLQWEAMHRAKERGCITYNLWGAPDEFQPGDGLWNVFRFKEGLGGYVSRTIGAWDYTPNRVLYKLYTEILPHWMDIMRSRGKEKTRQSIGMV
jgi:lipid II:glycine glycyltransferase (peptidoglycan interpeptide bridge formation enzyme)